MLICLFGTVLYYCWQQRNVVPLHQTKIVRYSMTFQKGHKKIGGRKRGTQNRVTSTTKDLLQRYIDSEIEALPLLKDLLAPKERIEALKGLLPYVYPRKQEINVKDEIKALLDNVESLTESQLLRLKEIIKEVTDNEQQRQTTISQ